MSAKANRIVVTTLAVLLAVTGAAFAIWISATVGDPRVGTTWTTIGAVGFVALLAGLFGYRIYRDR